MATLRGSIQLYDGMSKVLKNPIEKVMRLNKNLSAVGDNNSLTRKTMEVETLNQTISTIKPGALSELIEDGAVNEMSLMVEKANLINGSLATQSIMVQDLNKEYAEAVDLFGAQSKKALNLEKQLDKAVIKENAIGLETLRTNKAIQDKINNQNKYNDKLKKSNKLANQLTKTIKTLGGAYLGFLSARGMQRQFSNWLGLAEQRQAIEVPLHVTMTNMGATAAEIDSVKQKALELQQVTTFSDDVFLAGASELATYLHTGEAVEAMMETLADYSAGMGGMHVDAKAMTDYATNLGKALDGNFEGLTRKGFVVNDLQKEILETGTEMERVAVINDIIAESWGGMAEALKNTPQGKITSLKNEISSIHETIGFKLQPAVMNVIDVFYDHLPQIEMLLMSIGTLVAGGVNFFGSVVFPLLFAGLTGIINLATGVYNIFANNWTVIEPIVWGIVGAMTIYKIVTIALTVKTNLLTASTMALVKAKLKLALVLIKPLLIIGAIIGVVFIAIQIFIQWADTSLTTAGIIKGAVFVLGAFIFNLFSHLYNAFLKGIEVVWNTIAVFAEFFANVFIDPVGSVKNLFLSLFNFILSGFANIGRAIDKTIGRIPGINTNAENYFVEAQTKVNGLKTEPAIKVDRFDADDYKLDRISYEDAFKAGHDFTFTNVLGNNTDDFFGMGNYQNPLGDIGDMMDMQNDILGDIANNTGATAHNTGLMANEISISDEDLKYFRDIAEKEAIYRYTSQTVNPQVTVYIDKVEKEVDVKKVIEEIEKCVEEDLFVSVEGVYA